MFGKLPLVHLLHLHIFCDYLLSSENSGTIKLSADGAKDVQSPATKISVLTKMSLCTFPSKVTISQFQLVNT